MIWDIVTAWVCDAPHRLVCFLVPRGGCYFGWWWEPQEVRPRWKKPVIGGMPREMGFDSRLFVGFSQLLCPHEVSRPLSHAPVLWCSVLLQAQNNGLSPPNNNVLTGPGTSCSHFLYQATMLGSDCSLFYIGSD